jgi:hypothetical protein
MKSEESDFPYRFARPDKIAGVSSLTALEGLSYPLDYRWLRAHGLRGLTPWHFCDDPERATVFRREFCRETANRSIPITDLLPFAYRQDCDDIAGFVVTGSRVSSQVIEVHLTWKFPEITGYPEHALFDGIWEWLTSALTETRVWCSEEELAERFQ